ncbi:serine/arginine repetitive matrix protein 1-like [Panicum miliaceum]|uniref:Serine/arginine repetitive matrix protein 1-like n=1 Tax=Panicum miliaceum TaxID=4540 RepID=A0A3L6RZG7_PANMI|nr:serine/arginine repetitive matrix protein 1-like [Panicum miliaceum]
MSSGGRGVLIPVFAAHGARTFEEGQEHPFEEELQQFDEYKASGPLPCIFCFVPIIANFPLPCIFSRVMYNANMDKSGRVAFGDVSNTCDSRNQRPSHQTPQADDPKELKKQCERERYASMSAEQKFNKIEKQRTSMMSDEKRIELNKKRHERYKRKKYQSGCVENAPKQAHNVNPSIDQTGGVEYIPEQAQNVTPSIGRNILCFW